MEIKEVHLGFNGGFSNVNKPDTIILHHAAAQNCSIFDIHKWHIVRGFIGIGYHYFVDKEGNIYKGRPEKAIGAHAEGHNTDTLGICCEGNFEIDTMSAIQKEALIWLIKDIKTRHNIKAIKKHKDVKPTACPGKNYPFNEIIDGVNYVKPVVKEVKKYGIVTASVLNVRDGSSTKHKIIGKLKKGDKVKIGYIEGNWYNIYFGEHGGFVNKNYVKEV